jgi:hypothetical protein
VGEILVVGGSVALLMACIFMRWSLNIFVWRKAQDSFESGTPFSWRDPATWRGSKRTAAIWTFGIAGYVALGMGLTAQLPDAAEAVAGIVIAIPFLLVGYMILIHSRS